MTSRTSEGFCSIQSQTCCKKNRNIARIKPESCGLRNEQGLGFQITNSVDEAQYAEFPWMAALLQSNSEGDFDYVCGGSLIDPHVILTAAHCVHGKTASELKVRLGEWDPQTEKEILPHYDHEVSQVIIHSDFGETNLFNDVALLVLKKPAHISLQVNTVCLPPQNNKFNDNHDCIASGWGTDKYGHDGIYRANLKKLEMPIVQLKDCQDKLRATALGPRFRIHTSFICAGGEEEIDTCTGDGGSPLVCPIEGKEGQFYQGGIVAWGMKCGEKGVPGVYANVGKFRSWIDQNMDDLGYGSEHYTPK